MWRVPNQDDDLFLSSREPIVHRPCARENCFWSSLVFLRVHFKNFCEVKRYRAVTDDLVTSQFVTQLGQRLLLMPGMSDHMDPCRLQPRHEFGGRQSFGTKVDNGQFTIGQPRDGFVDDHCLVAQSLDRATQARAPHQVVFKDQDSHPLVSYGSDGPLVPSARWI